MWDGSPDGADPLITDPSSSHRGADLAIGGIAGLAGGLLGVGGGFIMVPLQTIWTHTPVRRATGTSLTAIVPIAIAGAAVYYFAKGTPQLNLKVAFFVMIGSSAGAIAGSRLAQLVPERALRMLVSAVVLVAGVIELYNGIIGGPASSTTSPVPNLTAYLLMLLVGVAIGTLSGLSGIGGGVLLVPVLAIGFGIGQRVAQGTSLLAVLPTAAFGALVHHRQGDVDLGAAGRMALAGAPAALVGGVLALWLPQRALAALFGLVLAVLAVRLWPAREEADRA
jgi:hypothetical protein